MILGGSAGFVLEERFPSAHLVAFIEGEFHQAQRENSRLGKFGGGYIGAGLGLSL